MPLKQLIAIDVDDSKFKDFLDLFGKYQEALKAMPEGWAHVGDATAKTGLTLEGMAALMLTQTEMLHRLTHEHQELERSASGYGRIMRGAAHEVGNIARSVADTTRHLLRWTGITGLIGAGSLFGLDHLLGNASSLRSRSLGLGVSPGTVLAAQTNFGQFFNAQGALGNLANLQQNLSGQVAFNTLGIPGAWNADPGDALTSAMEAVHKLYQQTPAGERQNMPWWQQATQIFSPEEMRVLGNLSDAERHKVEAGFSQDRAGNFGLQSGTLQAAQDVDRQLTRVGYTLEYTFLGALKPIMPELESLSKSLGTTVSAFLQGPGFANIVDLAREGLHDLGDWISSPDFKSNVQGFISGIGDLATSAKHALQLLGVIPDPNAAPPTMGDTLTAAATGAGLGAWLGSKFGPWGAAVGGMLGGAIGGARVESKMPHARPQGGVFDPNSGQWIPDSTFSGSSSRSAFDAGTTITDPTIAAAASIIGWRESKDQDVNNGWYRVWGKNAEGVDTGLTASGYYQMLDTNWHKYGAGLVDFAKYPHAKGAPRGLQDAVFAKMYGAEGYAPWDAAHGGSITSDQQFRAEMAERLSHPGTGSAAYLQHLKELRETKGWSIYGPNAKFNSAGQPYELNMTAQERANQDREYARIKADMKAGRKDFFGAPSRVEININNQTGGSAVVSASQMQTAY